MDSVSVQCSHLSLSLGVPFVGLGKFYTVDFSKEIGPLASLPREQTFLFPCQGNKLFCALAKGIKKSLPSYLQILCLTQVFAEPRLQKMASVLKFVMACNNVDWHPKKM